MLLDSRTPCLYNAYQGAVREGAQAVLLEKLADAPEIGRPHAGEVIGLHHAEFGVQPGGTLTYQSRRCDPSPAPMYYLIAA